MRNASAIKRERSRAPRAENIARLGLPIDDAGLHAQLGHRLDNERKAVGQVIPRAAVQLHPLADFASDNSKAVVLDFVQPVSP